MGLFVDAKEKSHPADGTHARHLGAGMGFLDKLQKTEQGLRKRIENVFGDGAARTPLELRREIIEQVEAHIVIDKDGKSFPYGRIRVRLHPPAEALADVLRTAFVDNDSLGEDIREMLADAGARFPQSLHVSSSLEPGTESQEPIFTLEFTKPEDVPRPGRLQATLVVVKGAAEQPTYSLTKERHLIGRLSELTDREGQMARRNDIVFVDNGDEVNSTVGRAHAAIFFDPEKQDFRIVDEVSRYGTRVFREGRSIEVPGGNPRGIKLKSGDEVYLGRACVRFELEEKTR
jgi:hypothetical protein